MLRRTISVMRNLMHLAVKHNIERNLYNSDAAELFYKFSVDNRITRWLLVSYDDEQDNNLWKRLFAFLEKEMKVQQRKFLIQAILENQRS